LPVDLSITGASRKSRGRHDDDVSFRGPLEAQISVDCTQSEKLVVGQLDGWSQVEL
jgi:hypothetical protein